MVRRIIGHMRSVMRMDEAVGMDMGCRRMMLVRMRGARRLGQALRCRIRESDRRMRHQDTKRIERGQHNGRGRDGEIAALAAALFAQMDNGATAPERLKALGNHRTGLSNWKRAGRTEALRPE